MTNKYEQLEVLNLDSDDYGHSRVLLVFRLPIKDAIDPNICRHKRGVILEFRPENLPEVPEGELYPTYSLNPVNPTGRHLPD
jgi:hypothetical protein